MSPAFCAKPHPGKETSLSHCIDGHVPVLTRHAAEPLHLYTGLPQTAGSSREILWMGRWSRELVSPGKPSFIGRWTGLMGFSPSLQGHLLHLFRDNDKASKSCQLKGPRWPTEVTYDLLALLESSHLTLQAVTIN